MQNRKRSFGLPASVLLPIGIICLFAFCSLALAVIGGRAYKNIQHDINDHFGVNVSAHYLRTKLSQNNTAGSISLRRQDDMDMLVIASTAEGGHSFETRILVADGKLMESYTTADREFDLADFITVTQVQECTFTITEDHLFTAEMRSPDGVSTRMAFVLAEGGAP